jgi:predicted nucleic acid-binding protein
VIVLDTNYLIRMLVPGTSESEQIIGWLKAGEDICASCVSWHEFLCGPVDDTATEIVLSTLDGRILPFTADQALEAARLFNATGRKRGLRVDAMIAAAAIVSNAALASDNKEDFSSFTRFGLKLRT